MDSGRARLWQGIGKPSVKSVPAHVCGFGKVDVEVVGPGVFWRIAGAACKGACKGREDGVHYAKV